MSELKRWTCAEYENMTPKDNGDYVEYDTHIAVVEDYRKVLRKISAALQTAGVNNNSPELMTWAGEIIIFLEKYK